MVEGFKHTEAGIIPNDWNVTLLGSIAAITKLAGFEYSKYFNSYKDGGDIIVIRGTNITNDKLDLSDVKTIPSSTSKILQRSKLFKGDLVFAYVGTIGPIYLVEEDNRFHLGPNTSKITLYKMVDTNYIFNYFKSWLIKNEIFKHTSIGAQPSLSMTKIRKFKIILPQTKAEQTAIATALNDADALIHQLEQLLTKKRNIKTGAMQELLKPKEGWEVKKLGDIFDISAGGDFKKDFSSETQNEKYPFPIYSNSLQNYGAYGFSTYYTNEADCITVTARGTIGYSCYRNHRFKAIGRLLVLKPKQNLDCFYFSEYINNKIEFVLEVTGVPQLTAPQISKYEVFFPKSKTDQTHIAIILMDMDNEIQELEKKLEKYKMLKQGMMQSLLTGKIRLI